MTTSTPQTDHVFAGAYVGDMRDAMVASLMAKSHLFFFSPPGTGKTDIPKALASSVVGDKHFRIVNCTPTTSPMLVSGVPDNEKLIAHSKYEINQTGTAYDPKMKAILFDELTRSNGAVLEQVLHVTDRAKQDHCVIWANSNFTTKESRYDALFDRFGLCMWVEPGVIDVGAIVRAQMGSLGTPSVPGELPTWETIAEVRSAVPGQKATDAVVDFLTYLADEATQNGFHVHPRLVAKWWSLAYFNSVYSTGKADFDEVPMSAQKVMKWAYWTGSQAEASKWQTMVISMADKIEGIIAGVLSNCVEEFKRVAQITDATQRTTEASKLGVLMANSQAEINQLCGDDPRAQKANDTISQWFGDAIKGIVPKYAGA